uniref:hypothetical protein n=1 Tax=Agathobacter sp. TaxID=2021311 RepID=UPI0040567F73
MQTIVILLNPGKLENPDMDLSYYVPNRIEEVSNGIIQGDGYDFVDAEEGEPGPLMGIWLKTENASENWPIIRKLLQNEKMKGNDLSMSARIYISEKDADDIENCSLVFPILKRD